MRFPPSGEPLGRSVPLIVVYASLAAINVRGLKLGLRVTEGITVIKLLPLILLAVVGLVTLNWSQVPMPQLPDAGQLGRGIVLLTFTFMGIETALSPSAEIRDPTRVVPRGLALALLGVTLLYFSLQLVAQGALGDGLATATDAPLASTAAIVLGKWGTVLMLSAGVVCMAGVLPGDMLCTPRVLYAMGRDGLLPSGLGMVHPRYNTPSAAIITYCVVCAVLALSGTFKALAILAAAGTLVMYLDHGAGGAGAAATGRERGQAALRHSRRAGGAGGRGARHPGGAVHAGVAGTGGDRGDARRVVSRLAFPAGTCGGDVRRARGDEVDVRT